MKTQFFTCAIAVFAIILMARCTSNTAAPAPGKVTPGTCDTCRSFAVYAEFARSYNKPMKDSLNRRVFNIREREHGNDIRLEDDGSVSLTAGTYRISGFSMVTMQTEMTTSFQKENYPGYCLVYKKKDEKDPALLSKQLCIGSPATSAESNPSIFDFIHTFDSATEICVGHQAGYSLPKDKIFLSVFKVGKDTSNYHVFSRIAVMKLY